MEDQSLIAALALVMFAIFALGYFIGIQERKSRRSPAAMVHSGRDDVEKRARRAF
jgi:VIT1/CCC1 family predicted Fe2+/Mn2+ transporter